MMSVAVQLGLQDDDCRLLLLAKQSWKSWSDSFPCLLRVGGVESLRGWLTAAEPEAADEVLHALVTLASPSGDDDLAAATVVALALLPGASALAHRLETLSPHIDELVAAQLWVEIRTFHWQRLTKVAANILANTRTGVLRECGVRSQLARVDRAWSSARPVDPMAIFWTGLAAAEDSPPPAVDELLDVFDWARAANLISSSDQSLLLSLAEAADAQATTRSGRGRGGLMANDVSTEVAVQWGISPVTVRRRARRALTALVNASADYSCAA